MKTKLILLICITKLYSFAQSPGTLDLSFGSGGYMTTDFSSSDEIANSVDIQTNGKIIVAGEKGSEIVLTRYNINGTLDSTFGTNGKVTTAIGNNNAIGYAVKVQSDGKIVLAGGALNSAGSNWDFALVRYDTSGVLDTSFGVGGIVISSVSTGSLAYSLFIQQNGKIVVCGMAFNGSYQSFAVVRYNNNGSIDNTFGANGQVITHIGSGNNFAVCMSQQNNGKIVVAGYANNGSNNDIAIVRYDSTGTLDNTFGVNGIVTTPIGNGDDIANGIAIQSDGKMVLAGWSNNGTNDKFLVVRYNENGILDNSFGTNGIVTTSLGSSHDGARAVAIASDGKIIVTGFSRNSSNKNTIAVVSYNSDGSLNNIFGNSGQTITQIGSSHSDTRAIALQSDGKIIVGGRVHNGTNNDIMVARYHNDLTLSTEQNNSDNMFAIFPNPFEYQTTILFDKNQTNTLIKIINSNGQVVKKVFFSGKTLIIDKENLNSGHYFIQITDEMKNSLIRNFVIQ